MSDECSVCFNGPVARDGQCQECIDWLDYWESLTPEQQQKEREAMAAYTDEASG
jgi:hypothetical protein